MTKKLSLIFHALTSQAKKTQLYEHYTKSNKTLKCADILLLLAHFFKIYPFN